MASEVKPAAVTIGSWLERLRPTGLLACAWIFIVAAGPRPHRASAVVACYGAAGVLSIWLLYRICRTGVRFDDGGVTFRRVFSKRRWNWDEVSHFSDGRTVMSDQGGSAELWALKMVLRDGRAFTVPGTARIPGTISR